MKLDNFTASVWFRKIDEPDLAQYFTNEYDYDDGMFLVMAKEYVLAHQCFYIAANKGHQQSMRELSEMYRLGQGIHMNIDEANKWRTRSETITKNE